MAACSDADGPMWRGMKPSRASSWVRLVRVMMGDEMKLACAVVTAAGLAYLSYQRLKCCFFENL